MAVNNTHRVKQIEVSSINKDSQPADLKYRIIARLVNLGMPFGDIIKILHFMSEPRMLKSSEIKPGISLN